MNIEKIAVSSALSPQYGKCIQISYDLKEKLRIPLSDEPVKVICGRNSIFAKIVCINEERSHAAIHEDFLKELSLPIHSFTFSMSYNDQKKTLELGPVIAVLTEFNHHVLPLSLGSIDSFCRELASCCTEKGFFFYVFSLSDYQNENMKGFILENNEWKQCAVPYPSVVHNRIHSRKLEHSHRFLEITADFIQFKVPYFNDRFLNKWEVHQILNAAPHLVPFIPKTELLESRIVLENMLELYPSVFLKPINGSQGKHIFKICHSVEGFELDYSTFSGHLLRDYLSFHDLFQSLMPRIRKEGFIVQEGIDLLTYENRPMDFRFLCHKQNFHQWKISSAVARVSAENQFVANLARGGSLFSIKDALSSSFERSEAAHIRKLLNELSIETAEALSLYASGHYGEFGIDLAIDSSGHPWIIEVNTKPSKNAEERNTKAARPSARAIIDYCLFLCNFQKDNHDPKLSMY
ncbi:YheC/YheD family protein [Metabacillus idriensis]|uniref:YheC/YheD family endospore coat-associated protein n=1 Tax=Metabacillus idriensis TaxID=324768 RepID=UPI00174BDB53|nr:YheC/YheD family protein [Metabacillus idriensis]